MPTKEIPIIRCPECASDNRVFRARKIITDETGRPVEMETKYRCRDCGNEWRVKGPGNAAA